MVNLILKHNSFEIAKKKEPFPGVATSRSSPAAKSTAVDAKSGLCSNSNMTFQSQGEYITSIQKIAEA
jgi:hypothetical protein